MKQSVTFRMTMILILNRNGILQSFIKTAAGYSKSNSTYEQSGSSRLTTSAGQSKGERESNNDWNWEEQETHGMVWNWKHEHMTVFVKLLQ